jgi:hypothetical protein
MAALVLAANVDVESLVIFRALFNSTVMHDDAR